MRCAQYLGMANYCSTPLQTSFPLWFPPGVAWSGSRDPAVTTHCHGLPQSHLWAKLRQEPQTARGCLGCEESPRELHSQSLSPQLLTAALPQTHPLSLSWDGAAKDTAIHSGGKCRSKGQELLEKNALIRS